MQTQNDIQRTESALADLVAKSKKAKSDNGQIIAQLESTLNHTLLPHTNAQLQYARKHMKASEQANERRLAHVEQHEFIKAQQKIENEIDLENRAHAAIMDSDKIS